MSSCPQPSDIAALVLGHARPERRAALAEHVAACPACRSESERFLASFRADGAEQPAGARGLPAVLRHAALVASRAGFEMEAIVGAGRQGLVVVGRAPNERVAIKILARDATPDERARFERETAVALQAAHPGLVGAHGAGVAEGTPYRVMPLVEGQRIDEWIAERRPSVRERVRIVAEACDAVAHLHAAGVVHRDIKPANVLVDAEGHPHVLDFGLAWMPGASALADAGTIGTLGYASPEQLRGDAGALDARTDVYALGAILYEALTGMLPRRVDEASREALARAEAIAPAAAGAMLDPALERIVLTALAPDPARRHASAAALRAELLAWLAGTTSGPFRTC